MTLDSNLLFDSFKEEADSRDIDWFSGKAVIQNKPALTFGLSGSFELKRKDGTQSEACSFFHKATRHLEDYFKYASSKKIANEIEIIIEEKRFIEIIPRWNQTILEEFESYLPKSKRGKSKPWYIDAKEWSGTLNENSLNVELIDTKVATFPVKEDKLSEEDLHGLSLKEIALLASSYCIEPGNPVWDEGCLFLRKDDVGKLKADLIEYYFEDEDDKAKGNKSFPQERTLTVTDRMVSIYNALQQATHQINSTLEWDSVFITISEDGVEDLQFILNDEELNFNYH